MKIPRQLITTCVCANLLNKCSSQSHVLFSVQEVCSEYTPLEQNQNKKHEIYPIKNTIRANMTPFGLWLGTTFLVGTKGQRC